MRTKIIFVNIRMFSPSIMDAKAWGGGGVRALVDISA